jgi:hypothetical protein
LRGYDFDEWRRLENENRRSKRRENFLDDGICALLRPECGLGSNYDFSPWRERTDNNNKNGDGGSREKR